MDNDTPLHSAIRNFKDDLDPIKVLLEVDDSDINVRNSKGETALHLAGQNRKCSEELIKLLLAHGADANATTSPDGNSVLHFFAGSCINLYTNEVATILLKHGSDANARNSKGEIPLHMAVKNEECSENVIKQLLEYSSDVNASDLKGDTPFHLAMANYKCYDYVMIRLFLKYGADVSKRNGMDETPLQAYYRGKTEGSCPVDPRLQILLQTREQQLENSSELHVACLCGKPDEVRDMLLKLGADVNSLDKYGYSPLAYTFLRYHDDYDRWYIVQSLLHYGADICHQITLENNSKRSLIEVGMATYSYRNRDESEPQKMLFGIIDFIEHIAKLLKLYEEQAEMGINAEALQNLQGILGKNRFYVILMTILNDSRLSKESLLSKCSKELEAMRETRLDESKQTFWDLMLAKTAASYVKNKKLVEAFYAKHHIFPMYQGILEAKIDKALERQRLIDNATISFFNVLNFADPSDEFYERTLSYCSNKDLINLIDGLKERE
ncbi:serine/threonine-protein phosphatase 6 regulatory ankyrin repeat subunit A [Nasonia vitripennis]|uniref:Uncharacterized protein n=1 Tax=Nasonia vitripennis TaxID=7425 RepID=A0A7M7Q2D7_NASVI|nr:serine/threonine-protein phosphatase 6 regulatory ankyrin repeat subunit A [Nasonia vitripennis]XP_008217647.1 serine/threonine-protein phosphatase 6 regulatory ankyrin repeat subunit A [Nasonia vitripennis]XP_031780801.1 serine/threonine-protein phosphatase 6 regulatory ankyrin repeat subunit A [Nasonia vitripennis]